MAKKIFSALKAVSGIGLVSSIIGGSKKAATDTPTPTPAAAKSGPIIKKLGSSSSPAKPVINRLTGQPTILRDTLGGG